MITDYDSLVAAILRKIDNDSLEDQVPEFIQLAEEMFNRRLYSVDTNRSDIATTTASMAAVSVPAGSKGLLSIRIGDYEPLKQLSQDDFQAKWHEASEALPQNYAIIDGDIHLGPTPDAEYTVNINYISTLTALSASNATNWILEQHPSLYLYAALVEAALEESDNPLAATYAARVEGMISEINAYDARKRRGNLVETVPAEYF